MTSPITPPPELVEQWYVTTDDASEDVIVGVANRAAQWGWEQRGAATEAELQQRADQELEACCEVLRGEFNYSHLADPLRAARRPKVPNKVDLALAKLTSLEELAQAMGHSPDDTIRLALERLKKLEGQGND